MLTLNWSDRAPSVRPAELNSFADILVSVAEADLAADITLGGRLVLSRSGELTAMSRTTIPPEQRIPHFIHVDEFQSFTPMLSHRCSQRPENSRRILY